MMSRKLSLFILSSSFALGLGILYVSLTAPPEPTALIFSYEVEYRMTFDRLKIVEIDDKGLYRFPSLRAAIAESNPLHPVSVPNRIGWEIWDHLGGEATDVPRARSKGSIYCYSVEVEGRYYNICLTFIDDPENLEQAMIYGAYWVAGWGH